MARQINIEIHPDKASDEGIRAEIAQTLKISEDEIVGFVEDRRSIDARNRRVRLKLRLNVYLNGETIPAHDATLVELPKLKGAPQAIIIGAGPAGLFAAWGLARAGIKAIIFERGGDVRARRPALAALNRDGTLDAENNYCFGEGGAGTFSDGKLYTRVKKGPTRTVLEVLVGCGAPERILIDTRPHIGTNRLPKVVQAMREYLLAAGVEFEFNTRVDRLILSGRRLTGVRLGDGRSILAPATVLATGHSARDIYFMLDRDKVAIEAKPYALGVRIEHPQEVIDKIQYGALAGHEQLGAAPYSLKRTVDDIGVYSFCMCPGGFIVPATTQDGHLVVNGMSPSKRNSKFANSGFVVTVDESVYGPGPLAGLEYQSQIERAAFRAGEGAYQAPAQRLIDFVDNRVSSDLPDCSYRPGLRSADLRAVLPPRIAKPMGAALRFFGTQRMRGYLSPEAVMVGVESRSSAPVRIPRDAVSLESSSTPGLYPCGEGAGYAGGIVSAALDGMKVASAIHQSLA